MIDLREEYEEYKKFLIEAVDGSQLKPEDKKEFLKQEINDLILKCSPYAETVEASHIFCEEPLENFLIFIIKEANFLATRGEGFITKNKTTNDYELYILRIDYENELRLQLFEFSITEK